MSIDKPQQGTQRTVFRWYRVETEKIVLFKALIEGYEGLAVVRTADPDKGIVQLLLSTDFARDVDRLIEELSSSMRIIPVPAPRPTLKDGTDALFFEDA